MATEPSQQQLRQEAHELFVTLMETMPPELKHQLLIEALQSGGPELLEGLEDARDAILFTASLQNPGLLSSVSSYVNDLMAEDGEGGDEGDEDGVGADEEYGGEDADGEDDSADDGFEADLAYAKAQFASSQSAGAAADIPAAADPGYSKTELEGFGDAVFGATAPAFKRPAPPARQTSEYSAEFVRATMHAAGETVPEYDGIKATDPEAISSFVNQLLSPVSSTTSASASAPMAEDMGTAGAGGANTTEEQIAAVQRMYQRIIEGSGIGMDGMPFDDDET